MNSKITTSLLPTTTPSSLALAGLGKSTLIDAEYSSSILERIKLRENSIFVHKIELVQKWIEQGQDLLSLQEEEECSQNKLTTLTGISKGSVSMYITLANDSRLLLALNDTAHSGEHLLGGITQKSLVKLTKLDDDAFNEYICTGVLTSAPKPNKEEIIEAELETSIEDLIKEKEAQVLQLQGEIKELKKQLQTSSLTDKKMDSRTNDVLQYDMEGTFIAKFSSLDDAAKSTNTPYSSIVRACNKNRKSGGGFRWEYADAS